ncbi:hypothetical protein EVAR_97499_1 [Eumeta japonica]|uniref:Uncharacterized protein n=1 Tax=Eumeta variegata TaxID=151549 RepID=A0A4C1WNY6_EUMVA|nr:hypothetical protein EVAR_97499_1 [Eumeta japonica]
MQRRITRHNSFVKTGGARTRRTSFSRLQTFRAILGLNRKTKQSLSVHCERPAAAPRPPAAAPRDGGGASGPTPAARSRSRIIVC